jgi:hypothetical protein
MKCGEIIGSGHVCQKCQEQFANELAAKSNKKAYALTVLGACAGYYIYSRVLPAGAISKVFREASSSYGELIPAITHNLEKIKEPATLIDIQFRLVFAAVIFTLIGAFALLAIARR